MQGKGGELHQKILKLKCFQGYWKKKSKLVESFVSNDIVKELKEIDTDLKEDNITEVP